MNHENSTDIVPIHLLKSNRVGTPMTLLLSTGCYSFSRVLDSS